ncbi:MAG: hypothetical protein GC136_09815 [Alphaproteobacteria bacterium]|nr:hypothetical protein [Alphaproteobacteria bacterium]
MAVSASSLQGFSLRHAISLKSFFITLAVLFTCFGLYLVAQATSPFAASKYAKLAEVSIPLVAGEGHVENAAPVEEEADEPQHAEPLTEEEHATEAEPEAKEVAPAEKIVAQETVKPLSNGITVTDVGFSSKKFDLIKRKMPKGTALVFDPHAPALKQLIAEAIQHSFIVKVKLPLQPADFPYSDTGAMTLMIKDNNETLAQKIGKLMALAPDASGFVLPATSAFDKEPAQKEAIMQMLKEQMVPYETIPANAVSVNAPAFYDLVK